jgi:hypothetical protein
MPKAASKPRRRRRAAAKKTAPRKVRRAPRKAARKPRVVRKIVQTTTNTQFRYSKKNPVSSVKMLAVGMVATGLGFGGAEIIDRLIVTRANQTDKNGALVLAKDQVITGFGALILRSNVPDGYRFGAAAGGTAVLGFGTYLIHRYTRSDIGVAILGGLTFGFGLKLASLGVAYVLPKILPVKNSTENTWQNQLFPENYFDQPTASASNAMQGGTFGGPRRFASGAVSRQDFGPTAGSAGCSCSRCAQAQGQVSGSPKAGEGQPDNRQALNTEAEQAPTAGVAQRMYIVPRKRTR